MTLPRVKVCCISSPAEAQMAIDHGAAALGLVGPMPSGPGIIDNATIARIATATPPPVSTFLLTSETTGEAITEHYRQVNTHTIQLVDAIPWTDYAHIRAALPHVKLVQVIHVIDERSIDEALQASEYADAILLDSGNPHLAVKALGGTGRTHDWSLSRRIREQLPIPLFLAGGLRPDNVQRAIEAVQPYGLDLCSGVRTDDRLDPRKLDAFFSAVGY